MSNRRVFCARGLLAALLVAGCAVGPAGASSGDEWEAFQKKVAKACIERAMAGDFKTATAHVDAFGTETYGLALVSGTLKSGKEEKALCAMDKKSGKAELGGESANWVTPKP
ncbi:hypothetical protein [Reyranella sp.]|uniref:hypothetical protein n=1 Tax=Reyranella sp. TaxID=1929291 RepID=UPI003BA8D726